MLADSSRRVIELERDILRALCCARGADTASQAAKRPLRAHAWRNQEHRVVFEALERVRPTEASPLREQLAAQVTRMGFPDVDWGLYFDSPYALRDIKELVRDLQELADA
jgi:hypothetical protein